MSADGSPAAARASLARQLRRLADLEKNPTYIECLARAGERRKAEEKASDKYRHGQGRGFEIHRGAARSIEEAR